MLCAPVYALRVQDKDSLSAVLYKLSVVGQREAQDSGSSAIAVAVAAKIPVVVRAPQLLLSFGLFV